MLVFERIVDALAILFERLKRLCVLCVFAHQRRRRVQRKVLVHANVLRLHVQILFVVFEENLVCILRLELHKRENDLVHAFVDQRVVGKLKQVLFDPGQHRDVHKFSVEVSDQNLVHVNELLDVLHNLLGDEELPRLNVGHV